MNDSFQMRIKSVVPETRDASSFILEPIDQNKISYKPGQFLTLVFNFFGKEIRRSYSLSSTPGIDENLTITVKRVINGEISRYMLEHLSEGDKLTAISPRGMFTLDDNNNQPRDIFLLAAGSGITPVYSILKSLLENEPNANLVLVYQNHSEKSTIFRNVLTEFKKNFPERFLWIDLISTPISDGIPSQRLNNDILERLILQYLKYEFSNARIFICGPQSFMRMCQFTTMLMGFQEEQLRKEYFVIPPAPPPPLIDDPGPKTVTITHNHQHHTISLAYPQTILDAALQKNINLPYSCRTGRCAACVAKCKNGMVKMGNNEVLTDKDLESGLVLTCVGYAVTDLELEY